MNTLSGYPCCDIHSLCPQHLQQLKENHRTALQDMLLRRKAGNTRYEQKTVGVMT